MAGPVFHQPAQLGAGDERDIQIASHPLERPGADLLEDASDKTLPVLTDHSGRGENREDARPRAIAIEGVPDAIDLEILHGSPVDRGFRPAVPPSMDPPPGFKVKGGRRSLARSLTQDAPFGKYGGHGW